MEERSLRKGKWVFLGAMVVFAAGFAVLTVAKKRPPYTFIATLHGEEIANPWKGSNELGMVYLKNQEQTFYAFKEDPRLVELELQKELNGMVFSVSGPTAKHGRISSYVSFNKHNPRETKPGVLFSTRNVPRGYTCVVSVLPRAGWLDEMWTTAKGWFGAAQG